MLGAVSTFISSVSTIKTHASIISTSKSTISTSTSTFKIYKWIWDFDNVSSVYGKVDHGRSRRRLTTMGNNPRCYMHLWCRFFTSQSLQKIHFWDLWKLPKNCLKDCSLASGSVFQHVMKFLFARNKWTTIILKKWLELTNALLCDQ